MFRSPPGTPTRAPRCATTEPARTSTATPTTSSPPTWPPDLTSAPRLLRLSPQETPGIADVRKLWAALLVQYLVPVAEEAASGDHGQRGPQEPVPTHREGQRRPYPDRDHLAPR